WHFAPQENGSINTAGATVVQRNRGRLIPSFCSQPCGQPWDISPKSLTEKEKRAGSSRNARFLRKKVVHSFC
ncbi:hypothetical protein ABLT15_31930, partial [Paraburkholderia tropica]|uniref:hypothetical protein n=1 Tax=Paraburkholderia tropica TaxID=92647 RepID=UPI0032B375C8